MSALFDRLLKLRGLDEDFLCPKYELLMDPFILPDMKEAVQRIKKSSREHEKILIYGDYDVDGVTASTLMEEALILAGTNPDDIEIMLPDRFADGYGMSPRLIARAKEKNTSLIITVDCGSRNQAIIDELNTLGIDTVVTDHHETSDELPNAVAVINPKRKDRPTEKFTNLAGVGVAFELARALVKEGMIKDGQEKWLLDLVVIGTICDNMTLIGENRILGFYGLKVLNKTRRPGLKELMIKAGVKSLNSESIGFQIGPRLNAAGRLDTANLSLDLLRAKTALEAAPLVEKLELLNKKRKSEQISATTEIKKRGVGDDPVVIVTGKWHEGILGIIAGRLVEEYERPAFVLTDVGNGIYKGSGRSFGDFNLAEALNYAKNSIIGGGGHAGAAGVKVEQKHLYEFREKINEYYRNLHLSDQKSFLAVHSDLDIVDFAELNLDFLNELKLLEPFGAGNEEPIFRLKNVRITNLARLGAERNHLRLDLTDKSGRRLKSLAFFAPESWLTLDPAYSDIEPLVKLTENDFNGLTSLESRIVDIDIINEFSKM